MKLKAVLCLSIMFRLLASEFDCEGGKRVLPVVLVWGFEMISVCVLCTAANSVFDQAEFVCQVLCEFGRG